MGKIVMLPNDPGRRAAYMENARLPAFYMGDYSVMGLLVEPYAEAVRILGREGYRLEQGPCGADIAIQAPAQVAEIRQTLRRNGVGAEIADVVDALYQA